MTLRAGATTATPAEVSARVLTVPNLLSLLRLLGVPVFGWLIVHHDDGLALALLAASGISDWLDGVLARRLDQVSRLGQLLDPAADRLYILATLLGLVYRGIVPVWLVVLLLARDVLLGGMLLVLRRAGVGPPAVHLVGKAATLNLLWAFPLLLLGAGGTVAAGVARPLGWAFAVWGTGLYWWAAIIYLRQAAGLLARHRDQDGGTAAPGLDATPESSRPGVL